MFQVTLRLTQIHLQVRLFLLQPVLLLPRHLVSVIASFTEIVLMLLLLRQQVQLQHQILHLTCRDVKDIFRFSKLDHLLLYLLPRLVLVEFHHPFLLDLHLTLDPSTTHQERHPQVLALVATLHLLRLQLHLALLLSLHLVYQVVLLPLHLLQLVLLLHRMEELTLKDLVLLFAIKSIATQVLVVTYVIPNILVNLHVLFRLIQLELRVI